MSTAIQENSTLSQQYLTFRIQEEDFALPIRRVREILSYTEPTPLPLTPDFIKGVINLRGNVVPVVDLSIRFSGDPIANERRTCIIIMEVESEFGMQYLGVLVTSVSEVCSWTKEEIEAPPQFGSHLRSDFVEGVGKLKDKFVIILSQEKVLSLAEMAELVKRHVDTQSGEFN